MPRQMPKNGTFVLARVADRLDLALGAAIAEAARHEDRVEAGQRGGARALDLLGVDVLEVDAHVVAMPPCTSASCSDLYESRRWTYLPTTPIFTRRAGLLEALHDALPGVEVRLARPDVELLGDLLVDALGVERERQLVDAVHVDRAITRRPATLEKSAIFSFMSASSARSQRQSRMSGWMPISRISFTECCVGLVLSSPAVAMYGTSVTWTLQAFSSPSSTLSWRIASRNGSDSMSPTVPPISTMAMSTPSARRGRALDLVGDVGMTCTVAPRYSPRRSLEMTAS
jgi:hypothetical protein